MLVNRLQVKNWRNFRHFDVKLCERQFVVGPNASGKSNFLDIFRFLRDIARSDGGGLQKAVKDRGSIPKIRCLAARQDTEISIDVELAESTAAEPVWRYALGIKQETRGNRRPILSFEKAWRGNEEVLSRPNKSDKQDRERLTQTHLENTMANEEFRDVATFLQSVTYLHLVPQLLRYAETIQGKEIENDPFGQGFLVRVAETREKTRLSRLKKIEKALTLAVPQLKQLGFKRDDNTGRPHLQALYSHWRPNAGWQQEDQFSDGTLRLVGLLWSLLESDSILLLEEPELSLNAGIVAQLAPLIYRMQRSARRRRQVILSTHSDALLDEQGIDGSEVLLLTPDREGTKVNVASEIDEIRELLDAGLSVGDAILPRTRPSNVQQLGLFE
jgi:predicted ATPase